MSSTTVTLDRSAYELLKAHKRPNESISEEVRRFLGGPQPSLTELVSIMAGTDGGSIADAIEEVRRADLGHERCRVEGARRKRGTRA